MTTSIQSGDNIFIQEGQRPAEQRFGLYMQNVSKFDKGHMIAMTEHVWYPKASSASHQLKIKAIQSSIFFIDRYKDARPD